MVPLSPPVPSGLHGGVSSATLVQTKCFLSWGAAPEFHFPCGFILGDNVHTLLSGVTWAQLAPTVEKEPLWG